MARILVADDDQDIVMLVRLGLERAGHEVRTAADGPAGLAAVQDDPPDLAVLDVAMPGMDGLEVCRRIRADEALAGMKVIVLTAAVQAADQQRALDAGADRFVKKPFSPKALVAEVEGLLAAG